MNWRLFIPVAAIAVAAAACSTADTSTDSRAPEARSGSAVPVNPSGEGPAVIALPEGPSALDDASNSAFPKPLIEPGDLVSGGPPPDGIPAIDDPVFVDVASNLEIIPETEPVIALEMGGEARAYPVRILVWHEIVNDTLAGVPVVVTYCPLCNSATAFDRRIGGAATTFGTSGMLYRSALVMYDRATESLWTHWNGTSVVGVLTGTVLKPFPSPLMAWGDFRAAYPTGTVLDWTQTGFTRPYGRSPYVGYDDPDSTPDLFRGTVDDRAVAMRRVVGISLDDDSVAYPLDLLQRGAATATEVGLSGRDLVIFWAAGQASALDDGIISDGRDVGTVGVFDTVVDGTTLSFAYEDGLFVDSETGSRWTITGEAVDGPLEGTQLERISHFDTFWFAWAAYEPDTNLVEG